MLVVVRRARHSREIWVREITSVMSARHTANARTVLRVKIAGIHRGSHGHLWWWWWSREKRWGEEETVGEEKR